MKLEQNSEDRTAIPNETIQIMHTNSTKACEDPQNEQSPKAKICKGWRKTAEDTRNQS